MASYGNTDPITMEVVKNALTGICTKFTMKLIVF